MTRGGRGGNEPAETADGYAIYDRDMTSTPTERAAVVALLRHGREHGLSSWSALASELLDANSALELLQRPVGQQDLFSIDTGAWLAEATEIVAQWTTAGIGVHSVLDESYPAFLRDIRERPPLLFTRGKLTDDLRAIAVVGSRKASDRGLAIVHQLATGLCERSVTVVSGLAEGIDAAAHQAALDAGGRTVAVIGTGVNNYYPAKNRDLQDRIAAEGLVVSQFWPEAGAHKANFPMRNAVMSGYSAATVIVEAGELSGSRIQARLALQHGRHVILLRHVLQLAWAKALADRPGVTVVDGPEDLFDVVESVLTQRRRELSPSGDLAKLVLA